MINLRKLQFGELARIDGFDFPIGEVISGPYLGLKGETYVDVTYIECEREFIEPCFASTLFPASA